MACDENLDRADEVKRDPGALASASAKVDLLEAAARCREARELRRREAASFDNLVYESARLAIRASVSPKSIIGGGAKMAWGNPSDAVGALMLALEAEREAVRDGRTAAKAIGIQTCGHETLRAWRRVAGETGLGRIIYRSELEFGNQSMIEGIL